MIFDGRNDFQIFETLIPNCAWCCQNKPQLPASAGRVLTYFSIDSALCPYRFFILFVFGVVRFLRKATKGFASGHHELFEKSSTKNFWSSSTEISTYFLVYLPSFSNTVSSWVEILNSLWDAKSCPALIAFGMLVSVPAPPTHPPGQAMPSSR